MTVPDSAPIDWSRLASLKQYDSDGSLVRGAIEAFLADAPGRLAAILNQRQAGDSAAMGAAAHALKGAALNVGARVLADACGAIEARARAGTAATGIAVMTEGLEATLDEVMRVLVEFMK